MSILDSRVIKWRIPHFPSILLAYSGLCLVLKVILKTLNYKPSFEINPIFLFVVAAMFLCPSTEFRIVFITARNPSIAMLLSVGHEGPVHFHPINWGVQSPFKTNIIQNFEFRIFFVTAWNPSIAVFLFVRHEKLLRLHPTFFSSRYIFLPRLCGVPRHSFSTRIFAFQSFSVVVSILLVVSFSSVVPRITKTFTTDCFWTRRVLNRVTACCRAVDGKVTVTTTFEIQFLNSCSACVPAFRKSKLRACCAITAQILRLVYFYDDWWWWLMILW